MSHHPNRDIKTLEVIADNWLEDPELHSRESSRTRTPHDSLAITALVITSSLAVQEPDSETVKYFMGWYLNARELHLPSMSKPALTREIERALFGLDKLFFFSLLTRKVELESGLNRLVRIEVKEIPSIDEEGDLTYSIYNQDDISPYIMIYRCDRNGNHYRFDTLVHSLLHEMCHAYLDLFSDTRHPKDHEWHDQHDGHGEMFWVLLQFTWRTLGGLVNAKHGTSENWRSQTECMNISCRETLGYGSKPGPWKTLEWILEGRIK
ncbi:hypothetical protein F5Y07DRAFT_397728 [Xylaria sp. FL0933]|nr:hypothetical protein F5Y07DRAFT_397728 [Xylaria sp. FL0933]